MDTVGVIVVDRNFNMAAGTSSGGISLKLPGRVGPSAIFGAGCYLSETVSCTNHFDCQTFDGDENGVCESNESSNPYIDPMCKKRKLTRCEPYNIIHKKNTIFI